MNGPMKYTTRIDFIARRVFDEGENLIASFVDVDGTYPGFSFFLNGLVHHGGVSLYDTQTGRYLVGTKDMVEAQR